MNQIIGVRTVAVLSFAFTYLFFLDYLPPSNRVHIPYDLEGFHSPLADYAFQAIRHGRFPEWDPTIYCGLSFVGNIQGAVLSAYLAAVPIQLWARHALVPKPAVLRVLARLVGLHALLRLAETQRFDVARLSPRRRRIRI